MWLIRRVANPKVAETNAFLVPNCGFFEYDNQVNLFESLGDTIYSISPAGDLSARYRLDWGSHQIVIENMSDQVAAKEYCYPQMIGETGDFLFISYIYQTKPALSLYNKRTKQVTHAGLRRSLRYPTVAWWVMSMRRHSWNGRKANPAIGHQIPN